ncbi:DEAD/DEAH box helicase [Vibrio sp. MA64]|uniref:DEAD/DEAH box helicase n=1 Tax=Vibrio sp. MA64 TaxID=2896365 RepID=UPI001E382F9C|nr:DEAD/DEAH box helicase family protein [Vibrio sp. MA64]MCC9653689.1 DEAD/DEAH box helicase family protein [Vibrio sp. MA64]
MDMDLVMELTIHKPLYYVFEKTSVGLLSKLALDTTSRQFVAELIKDDLYRISNDGRHFFDASLKKGRGKHKDKLLLDDVVEDSEANENSFFNGVNIHGIGPKGWELRKAQRGAIHGLLAHWSLSNEPSTIVLPTGTGKTETMMVATLVDRAKRTLVIVPTIDLKHQLSDKYASWGMLRELGVIPESCPNPTVIVIDKSITSREHLNVIAKADVVVSTPGLIANAPKPLITQLASMFSHVFFDEAHHVKASQWEFIKKAFYETKIVQFTATPYRNDRKPIEGKVVYNYPLSQAIEDKCFSRISLVAVDERHPAKKDKAIADKAIERLKQDRAKGLHRHKVMVRAEGKDKATELFRSYRKWYPNERITLIHNATPSKKELIKKIKNGDFDIVVCVDMLKEGFDYPDFKIAAVHSVHKSLAVLLQFIGRFTRTQEGLGDASFVVNYAEEKMSVELENLFQEGSGWELVISEIADAKKSEAESLLSFLQGCRPYSGFDSPEVELNPKLVFPALSCVCYSCDEVNWKGFKIPFNLSKYGLSQPYINEEENVFYFTTQKREKVKWARTNEMRDQTWDLIVMHFNPKRKLLFVGFSEKRLDLAALVTALSGKKAQPINGDCVFRTFDSIKRLSIIHAGIFKPANHLHRYSRLSGADVTTELQRWREGQRCKKSDFVGIGYRGGFPVSIGASVKGKVWSPARVGDLKEWKAWCLEMGDMITDESINPDQLLEDSAKKCQLSEYPENLIVLATDWSEELYDRMLKLTIKRPRLPDIMVSEAKLRFLSHAGNRAEFNIHTPDSDIPFSIVLGGENGHAVVGLDQLDFALEGLKSTPIPLKQLFEQYPPTMFLLNGSTIAGCIHTDYGNAYEQLIPKENIESLDWTGVDLTIESQYKSNEKRDNSIQEHMMKRMVDEGAYIVFNDDNSGESADIVSIFLEDELVRFKLIHCKYSKATAGARTSDLYEVCGQAIISLRYKWKTEELIKHMERRNRTGVLTGKRFYFGDETALNVVKQALNFSNVEFEFAIAQPGVSVKKLNSDMKSFLNSVYSTVIEMTETPLRCYFSD